jgi:hypothetical protein
MLDIYRPRTRKTGLATPVRNRYFYGKLLDVYHFELETTYFNQKRWLLNRVISGYGVVCGLDVRVGAESDTIVVTPGVALDGWGREIIVPEESAPVSLLPDNQRRKPQLPPAQSGEYEPGQESRPAQESDQKQQPTSSSQEFDVHVVICYHECESDPVPVRAGNCETADPCAPGAVREQYRICIREGLWEPPDYAQCDISDVTSGGGINYDTLVRWVTSGCPDLSHDPCIPLANIHVIVEEDGGHCHPDEIDITVRPIVYSNDLLYQLLLSLLVEPRGYRRGR